MLILSTKTIRGTPYILLRRRASKNEKINVCAERFEAESSEMEVKYALVNKLLESDQIEESPQYPTEIQQLLKEFKELVSEDCQKPYHLYRAFNQGFKL